MCPTLLNWKDFPTGFPASGYGPDIYTRMEVMIENSRRFRDFPRRRGNRAGAAGADDFQASE